MNKDVWRLPLKVPCVSASEPGSETTAGVNKPDSRLNTSELANPHHYLSGVCLHHEFPQFLRAWLSQNRKQRGGGGVLCFTAEEVGFLSLDTKTPGQLSFPPYTSPPTPVPALPGSPPFTLTPHFITPKPPRTFM